MKRFGTVGSFIAACIFGLSSNASAVQFDFGAIAEGLAFPAIGGVDTGEAGNITNDAEGDWQLVVPLLADGSLDDWLTIGGIGVKATGSNVNQVAADAFLDAYDGGLPGGLGVCSSTSCTSGVAGANTGDDNTSGAAGGETLTLMFTQAVELGEIIFRDANHLLANGTIILNGVERTITNGMLGAGVLAAIGLVQTWVFAYGGTNPTEFYVTTLTTVPIPPAVLLFGSALFGVGFMSRRKKAKALEA